MKHLLLILAVVALVGCASTKDRVVGFYELTREGEAFRTVFLDSGEMYSIPEAEEERWKTVNGQIHVATDRKIIVLRLNPDRSLTNIAEIHDGKRTDTPKKDRYALRRIKSDTSSDKFVGTYMGWESVALKIVLHKNGANVWEGTDLYDDKCWYVIIGGKIDIIGPRLGHQVFNIESNGDLKWIVEEGREKSEPVSFKKIK